MRGNQRGGIGNMHADLIAAVFPKLNGYRIVHICCGCVVNGYGIDMCQVLAVCKMRFELDRVRFFDQ